MGKSQFLSVRFRIRPIKLTTLRPGWQGVSPFLFIPYKHQFLYRKYSTHWPFCFIIVLCSDMCRHKCNYVCMVSLLQCKGSHTLCSKQNSVWNLGRTKLAIIFTLIPSVVLKQYIFRHGILYNSSTSKNHPQNPVVFYPI